jgi:putative Ca2+/H+ antiporter (TMEM165/GDT1 family)
VNSIGTWAGNRVAARIPMKIVKKVVGSIFILFGGLIVMGIL